MATDPLEVDTLPSDPREMAFRLLGMTVSELKGIDEKVVSGQRFVGGIKSDFNKIVQEVATNLAPAQINTVQEQAPSQQLETAQLQSTSNVETVSIPAESVEQIQDKDQLEFDFYKRIKPEDLEYQLKKVNSNLEDLICKIDAVHGILLKKNSKNINGNYRQ